MSLLLAATTGTDVVLACFGLLLLAAFLWGYNRWTRGRRWYQEQSARPAPVPPNGFNEALIQHYLLQLQRREEVALSADVARADLELVA